MNTDLYFLIPGKLSTLTGGYEYDRRIMAGLNAAGFTVHHIELSALFPTPDKHALSDAEQQIAAIPDGAIVLADGLAWGTLGDIARREHTRLRIVALCHHPLAFEAGLSTAQQNALFHSEKIALDYSSAVVVTSAATARLLHKAYSVPMEKLTVALPGTPPQTFAICQGNPPVLLTVATLTQRKAHDVLIDALSRITNLPWQARFAGGSKFDPTWTAKLHKMTKTLGLADRIDFLGSVADLSAEYSGADLFVLPSRFEGYGMVFAEALSYGLPVVAARAGAVPDVVPDTAGVLVPPDNATALALALHELLTDRPRFEQLKAGAHVAASQLPGWNESVQTLINLFEMLPVRPEQ